MAVPMYQRMYRGLRYAPALKPAMDAAAAGVLRTTGALLGGPEAGRLFVVGHMRSGSSLLSALVCENAEINGYGEAKVCYRSPRDFRTLQGKIAAVQMLNHRRPQRGSAYDFDKVLHQRLLPRPELLAAENTRTIFLLRPAEPTLRSIVGSLGWPLPNAVRYLRRQYTFLESLAERLPEAADGMVVTHADLIDRTPEVLSRMSEWLGLAEPLRAKYDPARRIAIRGSGDRSDRIGTGAIVREARSHDVDLADVPLDELEALHTRAVRALTSRFGSWDRAQGAAPSPAASIL